MSTQLQQPVPQSPRRPSAPEPRGGFGLQALPPVVAVGRCTCTTTTTTSAAGESIVVFRVRGDLDLSTVEFLTTALSAVCGQQPDHLIVDLSELEFCSARGLALLIDAGTTVTSYAIGAASPLMTRCWDRCWPRTELPTRFPTTADAVHAALHRRPAAL